MVDARRRRVAMNEDGTDRSNGEIYLQLHLLVRVKCGSRSNRKKGGRERSWIDSSSKRERKRGYPHKVVSKGRKTGRKVA